MAGSSSSAHPPTFGEANKCQPHSPHPHTHTHTHTHKHTHTHTHLFPAPNCSHHVTHHRWVKTNSSTKNHVDECSPCAGIDACETYATVSCAYIAALATGPNFTCTMLPQGNSSSWVFDLGRNMAGFCTISLPPTAPGSQIALVHGEILTPAGAVDNTYGTSSPARECGVDQGNCADQASARYRRRNGVNILRDLLFSSIFPPFSTTTHRKHT
jgi:hypothetical protein